MAEETKSRSAWGYVGGWALPAVLTVARRVLGRKVPLGPVAMLLVVMKTVLVAMFFMHLVEQPGARRVVLPVSALFLALLMGVTLIDAMTRVRLARPDGLQDELEPKRPASTRTAPPGTPNRWMGH